MDKVIRYAAIRWSYHYKKPKRGWPEVLYWQKLTGAGKEAQALFLSDFYNECKVNEIPFGYCVTICMKDTKPYKPQEPERVLKQRLARLETRMDEKFPLFAEEFITEHRERHPSRYDIERIGVEQQERKELVESLDPEVILPAKMAGSDTWKNRDWKMIRDRLRRILFANKRTISPEIMEKATKKERAGR